MRRQSQSQLQTDQSNDDCTSSTSRLLERVQPERVSSAQPEEDCRRRTIIIENKNGSYGFTLQSYGIHYKKEQEVEMITYVDYVEYDGPSYRAGMREGDVILSINGTDMEKVDHKSLVNFIKSCDSRMRMVVLFEDCVRKVELHIRYIQLQRVLRNKMIDLENICIKERQLLEGKWKTHSLPARKKCQQKSSKNLSAASESPNQYSRSTVSAEDIANDHQNQQSPSLIFTYEYSDPPYEYILQPSRSNSNEYLLTFNDGSSGVIKAPSAVQKLKQNKSNQTSNEKPTKASSCHNYSRNICNPCVQIPNNSDNVSLDAYDLASPCCNPHCVPSIRKCQNYQKDIVKKRDSKSEETQTDVEQQIKRPSRSRSYFQTTQTSPRQIYSVPKRYFDIRTGLMSQCSLYSCTSSDLSNVEPTTTAESSVGNTSLSTDTLYWNRYCDNSKLVSPSFKHDCSRYSQPPTNDYIYVEYNTSKTKSWDNLSTKAFGGYGFGGYGFIDSSGKNSRSDSVRSNISVRSQGTQYVWIDKPNAPERHFTPRKCVKENESEQMLLSLPKHSDSVSSCDYAKSGTRNTEKRNIQQKSRDFYVNPTERNYGYYSARKQTSKKLATSSEATRL